MKELNEELKQTLLAPFQSAEVRVRTYPYVAAYVTARVVMTRLDEAIPWQWEFKLAGPGVVDANGVMNQDGVLVVRGADGLVLEYHDRGSAPPDVAKAQAKQAKHAVSDCFKRCAVHLGVGRYLYELQGVQGGRIPKAGLTQALAAVGYHGPWDERHHGAIGGIREADLEDEHGSAELAMRPQDGDSSFAGDAAPSNGSHRGNGLPESPRNGRGTSRGSKGATVQVNDEQRSQIMAAIERGGGSAQTPAFLGWLQKNTANHAGTLDEVLSEDVDDLIRKLNDLAARRKV